MLFNIFIYSFVQSAAYWLCLIMYDLFIYFHDLSNHKLLVMWLFSHLVFILKWFIFIYASHIIYLYTYYNHFIFLCKISFTCACLWFDELWYYDDCIIVIQSIPLFSYIIYLLFLFEVTSCLMDRVTICIFLFIHFIEFIWIYDWNMLIHTFSRTYIYDDHMTITFLLSILLAGLKSWRRMLSCQFLFIFPHYYILEYIRMWWFSDQMIRILC